MKKWFKFFNLSFFSHKTAKEGSKRSYANFFLALILALAFIWAGFVGAETLTFGLHYNNASDFRATVHSVFANADIEKRISAEIRDGILMANGYGEEYSESLLVNTFENDLDSQNYSSHGYNVIIDTRTADTLAEVEAYCVSNDGKETIISYEEYLTLSTVARLNFDFKLKYTGKALELDDEKIELCRAYIDTLSDEDKEKAQKLSNDLAANTITMDEYGRELYELYFINYYPEISAYESSSKVPLLRNYYYHQYISQGVSNYLFIFDDYMAGSFETDNGIEVSFYGFYSDLQNGAVVLDAVNLDDARDAADGFIKRSFDSVAILSVYAYAVNVFSLIPFIALMPMVVTLLAYSLLKLKCIDSITSLGSMFKIIGSFMWMSALISAVLTVILAFFVSRNVITALPLVLFFIALAVRSVIFAVIETKLYMKQIEQQNELTEV